jgi:hypothetical protein
MDGIRKTVRQLRRIREACRYRLRCDHLGIRSGWLTQFAAPHAILARITTLSDSSYHAGEIAPNKH